MWANMRKRWLMKQMLYGFGALFLRPIKTLRGECQSFGVSQFLCNITSMASSLEIELVRFYLLRVIYFVCLGNAKGNLPGLALLIFANERSNIPPKAQILSVGVHAIIFVKTFMEHP